MEAAKAQNWAVEPQEKINKKIMTLFPLVEYNKKKTKLN
jgi:hypothetical protein